MDEQPKQKQEIIETLMRIYEQYFGTTTAHIYKQFYSDKDLNTILLSAKELLVESIGTAKGEEIFNKIYKQYNIERQL